MKKKLRIGFDMDDILSDTVRGFINKLGGKLNGIDLKFHELTDFNLETIPKFNITKKEIVKKFDDYIFNYSLCEDKPTKGVKTLFKSLKTIFDVELYVITARRADLREVTELWINKYFSGVFNEIYLTDFHGPNSKNKSEICTQLNLDCFIDDGHHNCLDIAENTNIKSYLFTKPWNKKYTNLHPNIIRINSWREFLHRLNHEHNH